MIEIQNYFRIKNRKDMLNKVMNLYQVLGIDVWVACLKKGEDPNDVSAGPADFHELPIVDDTIWEIIDKQHYWFTMGR